ncbi:polyprenol monophosphomannose synthase [Candidatus Parcubacteria bacterium]|nr:polyprenol monophosphomannose synthase [Candidatus Parcubacteria bacterium]MBI4099142.1 polyprenol monophosphomannose synthase [Candidatus Parcubacteria bacterium]MBI4385384.1 polyprenol monophosphomannose synthase [Candidatus Parcubacteria bacterium]
MRAIAIIPTYNEVANIARLVRELFSRHPDIHVLVIDDASPDGTANIVKHLQGRYRRLELLERPAKLGLGSAYREAFQSVLNRPEIEVVVTMDADFSHEPKAIADLLEALAGVEVAIGSRYIPGGAVNRWPLRRRLLSRFANWYARTILRAPVRDLTAGYHAIRAAVLRNLPWARIRTDGYGFLIELKWRLIASGARMREVPIVFTERRRGASKLSRSTIWEAVWLPWHLRFRA